MPAPLIKGTATTLSVSFTDLENKPLVPESTVSYRVFDFNGSIIDFGDAVQDPLVPSKWLAQITIPIEAPISDIGDQYKIIWSMKANGAINTHTDSFSVVGIGEPAAIDTSTLIMEGDNFAASIFTTERIVNDQVSLQIMAKDDAPPLFASTSVVSPQQLAMGWKYNFLTNPLPFITASAAGMWPYVCRWRYETEVQGSNTDITFIYVVNARTAIYINNMKMFLDKARNYDINPNLRWTDLELLHFLYQGLKRVNSSPPNTTNYSFNNLPDGLAYSLEKCAEAEALNALYLAEGFSAFNFSGGTTTMDIDRTQYIQTKMDEINNWLEQNLPNIKRTVIRSGFTGVLGVGYSPVMNMPTLINRNYMLQRLMYGRY